MLSPTRGRGLIRSAWRRFPAKAGRPKLCRTKSNLGPGVSTSLQVQLVIPAVAGGTVDLLTVRATSGNDNTVQVTAVNTTTITATPQPALTLEPDNSGTAVAGESILYRHTLTNNGTETDTIDLTFNSTQSWGTLTAPTSPVTLAVGETALVTVTVAVPLGAANGMVDVSSVTAVSGNDTNVLATATNTTTVGISPLGVALSPGISLTALAGEMVLYQHTVTNTSQTEQVVALTAVSSELWSFTLSPITVTLPAGGTTAVELRLSVPATAVNGTVDMLTVTAALAAHPMIQATAVDTTTITDQPTDALSILPNNSRTVPPGNTVTYEHTVTNLGNRQVEVTLSASSNQNWPVAPSPLTFALLVGQSRTVQVPLFVPSTAADGTVDVMMVMVSGNGVVATATNTTTVQRPRIYLPLVMRATAVVVPPTPTPTVTNTPVGPTATPSNTPTPTATVPPSHTPQCIRPILGNVTGLDLVVQSITFTPSNPAPGQQINVSVTIRNQGSVGVTPGNNFYVDLYVNQVPQSRQPGYYSWGVQGIQLGAGQSRTFTTQISFNTAGDRWFYAQVDTDNTVVEVNENNNLHGGCAEHRLTITGADIRTYEEPTATPSLPRPRYTPTPDLTLEQVDPSDGNGTIIDDGGEATPTSEPSPSAPSENGTIGATEENSLPILPLAPPTGGDD
jgi:uncharacterized membrane protein